MRKGGTTILRLVITVQTRGLDGIFTGVSLGAGRILTVGTLAIEHHRPATTIGILKVAVPPKLTRLDRIPRDLTTRIAVII